MGTNYSQIVQQSIEDKISMYMKLPKKKLAEMLANRDLLDSQRPIQMYPIQQRTFCRSWNDCTNPFHDCINCPVRNSGGFIPSSIPYTVTYSASV